MELISIKQAAAFLLGCDGCLIYTHANPDGDTIGSAAALALVLQKMGKKASIFSVDGIPEKLSFLPVGDLIITEEPENPSEYTLISVDVAGPKMLNGAKNTAFALSIDHHKVNSIDCERLLVMNDRIACGEIIFMLMDELGVSIDKNIAECLYTAISSDSGGFRYDATKPETHIMAAKCLEAGIDFAEINRRLFECKTKPQVELIKTAYQRLEFVNNNRFAIVAIPPHEVEKCGATEMDFDCINSIPREIAGVLASAVIRQKSDCVKVSIRSNADIDVAEIARSYNGGGHYHAAGFSHYGSFDEAVEIVRSIFSEIKL